MEGRTNEDMYSVLEWSIKNFSCWNCDIHGQMVTGSFSNQPLGVTFFNKFQLYPRGLNCLEEHLSVRIDYSSKISSSVELSFISSDESIIWTQVKDTQKGKNTLEIIRGPKFEELIGLIRKNEALYKDILTLRCRIKSHASEIRRMCTVIEVFDTFLKVPRALLNDIEYVIHFHYISSIIYHLSDGIEEEIMIVGTRDKHNHSKIGFGLVPLSIHQKSLVLTRMFVLNSDDDVLSAEENKHVFHDENEWVFAYSPSRKEVNTEEFYLILRVTVIPSIKYRHKGIFSFLHKETDLRSFCDYKDILSRVYGKWNPNIPKPISTNQPGNAAGMTALSKELTCLYQDQDFSDFQLRCKNVSFNTHRAILSARSSVFKGLLSTESASVSMDIIDLDPSTLAHFLAFLYAGTTDKLQWESALKLYYAADKYQKLGEQFKSQRITEEKASPLDFLRYPQLRQRFLLITICWISGSMPYYGHQVNARNLAGNEYLNFLYLAAVEVPATFAAWSLMECMGRRWCAAISFLLATAACCLPVIFPPEYTMVGVISALLAKGGTSAAYMTVYIIAPELFPTSLRAVGMGLCSTIGSGSTLIAPYIVYLAKYGFYLPFLCFGVIAQLGMMAALALPETLDLTLPQTVANVEEFVSNRSFFTCGSVENTEPEDTSLERPRLVKTTNKNWEPVESRSIYQKRGSIDSLGGIFVIPPTVFKP